MFRKTTRRNIRKRKDDSSEDEKKEDEDDSEMPPIQIKSSKQTQTRGIACSSKPQKSSPKSDCAEDSDGQTAEPASSLSKEDANTKPTSKFTSKSTIRSFEDDNDGAESNFKIKKSEDKLVVFNARKKDRSLQKRISNSKAKEAPLQRHTESDSESPSDKMSDGDDDSHLSSVTSCSSLSSALTPVSMPDAKTINAAKEARSRARAQKDYIPLKGDRESTPGTGEDDDLHSVEHDSDNEPDDHERRIEFAPRSRPLREQMAEAMGDSNSEDSSVDSEEEEAQNLWETQQITKGVKRPQISSKDEGKLKKKKKLPFPESLPAVSINIIKRRILGKIEGMREVHRAHEADMRRLQFDVEEAKNHQENLEKNSPQEQLTFYRNMRIYSDNLIECLTEKTVVINSLELEMHSLYINQAEALSTLRREAVRTQSSHLQQLSFNMDPDGGETAKDILQGNLNREEGMCEGQEEAGELPADVEAEPEEMAELQRKRAEIVSRAEDVFSDVHGDFSDISKILSKFDEWRRTFPDSYNNAYIGLYLPKLLSPLVRHQLIGWSPFQSEGNDFEALPWYSAVEKFCHCQGYEEFENADLKTIPGIIEKTVLPKVQGFVELVWDPLSLRQTQCLTSLCRRLQDDYSMFSGNTSKHVKAFILSVTGRLRSAVDEDVFIPLYPKKVLEDQSSPQYKFQEQQFWSAVKLLGNITQWNELLQEDAVLELALDKLLNRYLMMTLLNESDMHTSVEKSRRVAACFPKSWFQNSQMRTSLPQLKSFCSHLLQTAHTVCKDSSDIHRTRDVLRTLFGVMADIKALDDMTTLANKYHHTDLMRECL